MNFYEIISNAVYTMILLLLIIIWLIPLRVKFCFFFFFLIKITCLMPRRNTVKTGIFVLFLTNLLFPLFSFTLTLQSTHSRFCIFIYLCTFSSNLLNKVIYFSNHMCLLWSTLRKTVSHKFWIIFSLALMFWLKNWLCLEYFCFW